MPRWEIGYSRTSLERRWVRREKPASLATGIGARLRPRQLVAVGRHPRQREVFSLPCAQPLAHAGELSRPVQPEGAAREARELFGQDEWVVAAGATPSELQLRLPRVA